MENRAVVELNPRELDEATIQALAIWNPRAAFDAIIRLYREQILTHAAYILKDVAEAYDVTQEVFIKAMRETRFFDSDFKRKAWLFRVTSNLCFNLVRDRRRRSGLLETLDIPNAASFDPIENLFADEQQQRIFAALDRVSEEHRQILMLRYYSDLSYLEIADTLGVKLGTIMSRLSRAKTRLMEALDEVKG